MIHIERLTCVSALFIWLTKTDYNSGSALAVLAVSPQFMCAILAIYRVCVCLFVVNWQVCAGWALEFLCSISNRSKFILLKHCQFKFKVYYIRSTKKELQFSSWWLSMALLIAVAALTVTKSAASPSKQVSSTYAFVCLFGRKEGSTVNSSYKVPHYLFINWQWHIIGPVVQENAEIMTWKHRSTNELTFPWCSKIFPKNHFSFV